MDRFKNVNLSDKSQWANTSFAFARQLYNMLELSRVIVQRRASCATNPAAPTTSPTSPTATTRSS